MAGPVTHIVLALQALALMPDKNPQEFIIGTSFPDIRYLGVISREQTHFNNSPISFDEVKREQDSFKAGMMFHVLVDQVREQEVIKQGLYGMIPRSTYAGSVLKLNEDILLHKYLQDLPLICSYFDTVLDQERAFGVDQQYLRAWHRMIQQFLRNPSLEQAFSFMLKTAKKRLRITKQSTFAGAQKAALYALNKVLFMRVKSLYTQVLEHNNIKQFVLGFHQNFMHLL